jgi:putative transposase
MLNINPELLDELLKEYTNPQDLMGANGILKQLTKAIVERCLNTEMTVHLESNDRDRSFVEESPSEKSDRRVAKGEKIDEMGIVQRQSKENRGELEIQIPRDSRSGRLCQRTFREALPGVFS